MKGLPDNEMIRFASHGATDSEAFWIKMFIHFGLKVKDISKTMSLPSIGSLDVSFKQDGSVRVSDILSPARLNGVFSVFVQSAPREHFPDRWVAYVWGVDGDACWVLWQIVFQNHRPARKGCVKEYASFQMHPEVLDPMEVLSKLPTDYYSKYVLIWVDINKALVSLVESRKAALQSACEHAEGLDFLDKILVARTSSSS